MSSDLLVRLVLQLRDNLSAGARRVAGQLSQLEGRLAATKARFDAMRQASQGMLMAGAAITAPIAAASRAAMTYEAALGQIATMTDASLAQIKDRYGAGLLDLAVETGQSTDAVAQAMYDALSAGVSEDRVMDFLRGSGRAAVAGATDISAATDGLTTAMNAWRQFGYDVGQTSDIMFTAVRQGKTTFGEIAASVGQVASISAAAGVRMEETMAAMSTLTANAGLGTSQAFAAIRATMQAILNPTSQAREVFADLGLDVDAAALQTQGYRATIEQISQAINAYTTDEGERASMLAQVFGQVEGLVSVMSLGGAQSATFAANLREMGSAGGATGDAFAKMAQTSQFQFNQLKTSIKGVGIILGDMLLPTINRIVGGIMGAIARVREWVDNNGRLASIIVHVVGGLGVFLTVLGTVGLVVGTVGSGIAMFSTRFVGLVRWVRRSIPAMLTWIKTAYATAAANTAMLGPILAVIAVAAALAAAAYLVIKHWDKVKAFFGRIGQAIVSGWEWVRDGVVNIAGRIGDAVTAAWARMRDGVTSLAGRIRDGAVSAWSGLRDGVVSLAGRIRDGVVSAWTAIRDRVSVLGQRISAVAGAAWTRMREGASRAFSALRGVVSGAIDSVREAFRGGLINGIRRVFELFSPAAWIAKALRALWDRVSEFSLFDAGRRILSSLADGIRAAVQAPIEAVRGVVGRIRDHLPFSPAKEGPLRDIDQTGGALMRTMAQGVEASPVLARLRPVLAGVAGMTAPFPVPAFAGAAPPASIPTVRRTDPSRQIVVNLEQTFNLGSVSRADAQRVGEAAREGVREALERIERYDMRVNW